MEIVAKRVLDSMAKPFVVSGGQVMVTASIGVAVYPVDGQEADELLGRVQGALNAVQEAGGANYQFPASRPDKT
jgi:GGDEF domain-containing protein